MNKNDNRNEQMVLAFGVVGCELNKETGIRRGSKIKVRGKKKQVKPHEVRRTNSFCLSGESVCVLGDFHDRTGWEVMAA